MTTQAFIADERLEAALAIATRGALVDAINRACAARGDSDAERDALVREALELPDYLWPDLQAHFAEQARIFQALPAPAHRGAAAKP
jgi:hypothetical protein